eukprot:CAMPEP_0116133638 /NCGR_PEP_ID=MMETSP0329-20121206/10215_1 /TAXON_ID=697910 /ORGANISM="Pseudo-nitzschia arenysensis, Strain B593" /LENGTH=229 /DNA_ID=CAMNT_0003628287 /DNA_START=58 /DNA_END=747 /DNA_ORIENTATION=-
MKFISSVLVLLLAIAPVAVKSHSTEVHYCFTPDLYLRIFIAHWHGDLNSVSQAGTLDFTDNIAGTTLSLAPDGIINNKDIMSLWTAGECAGPTTMVSACINEVGQRIDWVYYEFPIGTCEVSYTIEQGSSINFYLEDACFGDSVPLFPANIIATTTIPCPSEWPSVVPSVPPSSAPSSLPSEWPSLVPSVPPSSAPSSLPTKAGKSRKNGKGSSKSPKTVSLRGQDINV